jgi:hypothetical protein
VVAVLVVLSLVLITISFREPTGGALGGIQGAGVTVLRPFEIAAERVARPFRDVYGYFRGLAHAKQENKRLRAEVERLDRIVNPPPEPPEELAPKPRLYVLALDELEKRIVPNAFRIPRRSRALHPTPNGYPSTA